MGLIGAVIVLLILIFPFYVLSQLSSLRNEVDELKRQLQSSPKPGQSAVSVPPPTSIYGDAYTTAVQTLNTTPQTPAVEVSQPVPPAFMPAPQKVAPLPVKEETPWIAEDTFMKIGAFLILLAVGWFVSYAFANNWISPVARIVIGVLFGLSIMAVGVWRAQTYVRQGAVLVALGMSTALVTLYAARFVYDFMTPATALIAMFVIVAITAAISVRYKVEALAVVALCGGALAPLLIQAPVADVVGLHTYLGVLFAGALFVAAVLPAASLVMVSLFIAFLYGVPYMLVGGTDLDVAILSAMIYAAAFFGFSLVALVRSTVNNNQAYLAATMGVGMYVVVFILTMEPAAQGIASLIWAAGFLFAAAMLWSLMSNRVPAYVQGGMSLAFFALATAFYLDGTLLTIAYLMQITVLVLVALYALRDTFLAARLSWLYSGVVFLSLPHFIASSWDVGILNTDFFILLLLSFVFMYIGSALYHAEDETDTGVTLMTVASLYLGALVWLITHTVFGDQVGTALSLVTYTLVGLSMYIIGQRENQVYIKTFGVIIICGVLLRLFVVDVWELDLIFRIIAFFTVGVLLVGAAFIKRSHQ